MFTWKQRVVEFLSNLSRVCLMVGVEFGCGVIIAVSVATLWC